MLDRRKKDMLHPEQKVRWKGCSEKHVLWVAKEDMSDDCIREFHSIPSDDASSILATVLIVLNPSSLGHAMAHLISTMVKQKVMCENNDAGKQETFPTLNVMT